MAQREDVQTSIWTGHDEFIDLSPDAKLLYLWSFTNSHVNMAGLYRIARQAMRMETTLPPQRFERAFAELVEGRFLLYEGGVLWVRTRVKHLWSTHANFARSIAKDVRKLGDHPLAGEFLRMYRDFPWLRDELSEIAIPEPKSRDSGEGLHRDSLGNSNGKSSTSEEGETTRRAREPEGFAEWLAHHEQTTGMRPPGERTKVRQTAASMFAARLSEDYSLEDLKLATVGAFNDDHRREHGYYGHVSVLRPEKVHDLVEKGRRGGKVALLPPRKSTYERCRGCGGELVSHSDQASGFCGPCDEVRAA